MQWIQEADCTIEEQARIMDAATEAVGDRLPLVHGIYADGSLEAAHIAKQAAASGASALLVFPPGPFTLGQNTEMGAGRTGPSAAPNLRHSLSMAKDKTLAAQLSKGRQPDQALR